MRLWLPIVLLCTLATGQIPPSSMAAPTALQNLFAPEWDYEMRENPQWASELGYRRWNDRWSDETLEAYERRNQHYQAVLAQLATIDRNNLPEKNQLNYDLFQKRYQDRFDRYRFHWFLLPLNQREGIHTEDDLAQALRFTTVPYSYHSTARLRSFPPYIPQTIKLI